MVTPSPFPPSFEGNPIAYCFGLFGDVVAASLALAMLLTALYEPMRKKQIAQMLGAIVHPTSIALWSPLFLYRATNKCLLLFVVMRTLPDAAWMLAWGEVSDATITIMLALDLWCDGLALVPFFFAVMCWAWGRQVIPQMLMTSSTHARGRPDYMMVWRNARIVVVVLLIAIGVTIGKAAA